MKNLITIFIITICLTSFGQNNAPIAVNDTLYLSFNASLSITQLSGLTMSGTPISFLSNDQDPDGNNLYIDSAFYNGSGNFSDSLYIIPGIDIHKYYIDYTPPLNFWGVDSLKYFLYDNGIPVMYDTATTYIYIRRPFYETLDLNNVNASFGLNSLFSKTDYSPTLAHQLKPGFEVPKGSGANTIYSGNLWISGKNQNNLYLDATTFGGYDVSYTGEQFHSRSGPLMDSIYYEQYSYQWDRHWKITSNQINYHINNWNTSGYQPIEVIANWPAHGDVNKGQAANLAPFIDSNNDGNYNPLDGDYPKIKGQQAVYFIYNDFNNYTQTGGVVLGCEFHYMAYAYNCPSDSAINNTIFLDYTIYNRSNLTYDSTYIGMWTDFDLGNSSDDFVGSDVERSTYYVYNGDSVDESANGVIGYGVHPPAQGVVFLKGAKQDNDGIDNTVGINALETINGKGFGDGIPDNEYWGMEYSNLFSIVAGPQGVPQGGAWFHNFLSGKWGDSSTMVFGGTGHFSGGGTIATKYMFPGNSDPLLYGTGGITPNPLLWTEVTEGNPVGDRRGVGSTGPFTFEPDSSISITLAFVFGRDYQNTGPNAGVVVMQERIDSIRSYYANDFSSVCGGFVGVLEEANNENGLTIYPNPFNNQFTINYKLENNAALLEVYNLVGEKTATKTITKNSTLINLSNLPNGFYFITITDGNKKFGQKIIKQ